MRACVCVRLRNRQLPERGYSPHTAKAVHHHRAFPLLFLRKQAEVVRYVPDIQLAYPAWQVPLLQIQDFSQIYDCGNHNRCDLSAGIPTIRILRTLVGACNGDGAVPHSGGAQLY